MICFHNHLKQVSLIFQWNRISEVNEDQVQNCKPDLENDSDFCSCFHAKHVIFFCKESMNTCKRNQKQVKCLALMVRLATISKRWWEGDLVELATTAWNKTNLGEGGSQCCSLYTVLCFALGSYYRSFISDSLHLNPTPLLRWSKASNYNKQFLEGA